MPLFDPEPHGPPLEQALAELGLVIIPGEIKNAAGILYPDKWGHWYRGKNATLRQLASYYKGQADIKAELSRRQIIGLERLYPTWTPEDFISNRPEPSPLQKASYAHHLGSWAGIRAAILDVQLLNEKLEIQLSNILHALARAGLAFNPETQAVETKTSQKEVIYHDASI